MVDKEQITKEEKRKAENRRNATERRESDIPYEMLNYNKPDRRSGLDRRSGKDRRVTSV